MHLLYYYLTVLLRELRKPKKSKYLHSYKYIKIRRLEAVGKKALSKTVIKTVPCDLMDLDSVKQAALQVSDEVELYDGLDVLANNAGIMAFPDIRTINGFDVQMQTNHLSHFLLTQSLLPSLQCAATSREEARIVQHSSGARLFKQGSTSSSDGTLEAQYFERCAPNTLGGNALSACGTRYHMTKLANAVGPS